MLYYTHVNEDSSIERKLLEEGNCQTVVAVAGSGERVIALLDHESVKDVKVVDVNNEALYLLELKVVMLQNLTVEQYLIFIGHLESKPDLKLKYFTNAKQFLTPSCRSYWEKNIKWIEKGILNCGHFEIFLSRIRPAVITFLGGKFKRVLTDGHLQLDKSQKIKWQVLRWMFGRRWVYNLWGNKDIAFVGQGSSPEYIPEALNEHLKHRTTHSSFITHLIFNGHLRELNDHSLPLSLQHDVLKKIRQRLISKELRVEYHHSDLLDFVARQSDHVPHTFYSASDILSFENHQYVFQLLKRALNQPGNVMVIRAFLRNRMLPSQINELAAIYPTVRQFDEIDNSRMYQVIAVSN